MPVHTSTVNRFLNARDHSVYTLFTLSPYDIQCCPKASFFSLFLIFLKKKKNRPTLILYGGEKSARSHSYLAVDRDVGR